MSSLSSETADTAAPRRRATVAVLYTVFALATTSINLGAQAVVLQQGGPVLLALVVGTLVGLPIKYVLDKRYIFQFMTERASHDARLFILYTAMSVVTTVIFWGAEWLVHRATEDTVLTLLGGAVGLGVGYAAKYQLDKRFVFVTPETQEHR